MIDATHRNTALLVAGCFFMEMLDGTIVTTAAPQIGRSPPPPATSRSLAAQPLPCSSTHHFRPFLRPICPVLGAKSDGKMPTR